MTRPVVGGLRRSSETRKRPVGQAGLAAGGTIVDCASPAVSVKLCTSASTDVPGTSATDPARATPAARGGPRNTEVAPIVRANTRKRRTRFRFIGVTRFFCVGSATCIVAKTAALMMIAETLTGCCRIQGRLWDVSELSPRAIGNPCTFICMSDIGAYLPLRDRETCQGIHYPDSIHQRGRSPLFRAQLVAGELPSGLA